MPILPILIRILQRIVEAVGVPVEVLRGGGILDEGVRAEESPEERVVDARIGVYQAATHDVFVSGVAVGVF